METLSICVRLCEQGINPEALSSVIKELRKATEALKVMLEFKKPLGGFSFFILHVNIRVRIFFLLHLIFGYFQKVEQETSILLLFWKTAYFLFNLTFFYAHAYFVFVSMLKCVLTYAFNCVYK